MTTPRFSLPGITLLGLAASTLPTAAFAHVGGHGLGFMEGFAHPVGGLDHILAMIAVGLWAAQGNERARWQIPAAFVLVMMLGGLAGAMGLPLPYVEEGIVLSVLILGLLTAAAVRLPAVASVAVVGAFAMFHGHAHGAEMPADATGLLYGLGFALATALLHGAGIALVLVARRCGLSNLVRLAGGTIAMSGMYLWMAA